MLATQNKHLEVVELLLKHSADVTAVNNVSIYTYVSVSVVVRAEFYLGFFTR